MSTFILKITLGNDAMITGYDIAGALREVAGRIENPGYIRKDEGRIMDLNGNTVGTWRVR